MSYGIINCSPVRNGATAEIVNVVKENVMAGNVVSYGVITGTYTAK